MPDCMLTAVTRRFAPSEFAALEAAGFTVRGTLAGVQCVGCRRPAVGAVVKPGQVEGPDGHCARCLTAALVSALA